MECAYFPAGALPADLQAEYDAFLNICGLRNEMDADLLLILWEENGSIAATGALKGNVLKQIAAAPDLEGQGLCAEVVTRLVEEAVCRGKSHLFLYTKPCHIQMFSSLGFFPVVQGEEMAMLENRRTGLQDFLRNLPHPTGTVGAVVCNCDPFTLGHRHLMEYAAMHCDTLLVFVLSEDLSTFPAAVRYDLVQRGTADLKNVRVLQGGPYVLSQATFPTYFIKDKVQGRKAACELDLLLFARHIAPALNISIRFVGQEPFDAVTRQYNELMKALLPQYGIQVREIPRLHNISASEVRRRIAAGTVEETKGLLPKVTYDYCIRHFTTGA